MAPFSHNHLPPRGFVLAPNRSPCSRWFRSRLPAECFHRSPPGGEGSGWGAPSAPHPHSCHVAMGSLVQRSRPPFAESLWLGAIGPLPSSTFSGPPKGGSLLNGRGPIRFTGRKGSRTLPSPSRETKTEVRRSHLHSGRSPWTFQMYRRHGSRLPASQSRTVPGAATQPGSSSPLLRPALCLLPHWSPRHRLHAKWPLRDHWLKEPKHKRTNKGGQDGLGCK